MYLEFLLRCLMSIWFSFIANLLFLETLKMVGFFVLFFWQVRSERWFVFMILNFPVNVSEFFLLYPVWRSICHFILKISIFLYFWRILIFFKDFLPFCFLSPTGIPSKEVSSVLFLLSHIICWMILGKLQAFPKEVVLISWMYVIFITKSCLLAEISCQKL